MRSSGGVLGRGDKLSRDLLLFAAVALAPVIAIGVLGLRAIRNEEAGARREASLALEASAQRASLSIATAIARAQEALARVEVDRDPRRAAEQIRAIAPPFAEAVVLAPDRRVVVPEGAPARGPAAVARCDETVESMRAAAAAGDAGRLAAARKAILVDCREARTDAGRWIWPIVAIDAPERAADLADWLGDHAALLSDAEREATRLDVEGRADWPAAVRDRALASLRTKSSRRDEIVARVRGPGAAALRHGADASGFVTWRGGASVGVLRVLSDGRLAGFIVDTEGVVLALGAHAIDVPAQFRALVSTDAAAPSSLGGLAARADVAPDLFVWIAPADPASVAASASRGRALLAAMGITAVLVAVSFAALLFRRLRAEKRSSELRTDFVSTVSHELRTPIASMRMLAELLEEGRVEPEEHKEVFETIARESRRLAETVDRLLGFSRMAAGRYVLERKEADVAPAVAASIDTFEERHPGARIERDLDPVARASIDAGQIRLAVDNLLENAKKYAPSGEPYRVSVSQRDGVVTIAVEDRGPGVARADQRRIFEPFERADDKLSRTTEGSGIGLSLVRHVARAHGGEASVESEPGKGARFVLTLRKGTR